MWKVLFNIPRKSSVLTLRPGGTTTGMVVFGGRSSPSGTPGDFDEWICTGNNADTHQSEWCTRKNVETKTFLSLWPGDRCGLLPPRSAGRGIGDPLVDDGKIAVPRWYYRQVRERLSCTICPMLCLSASANEFVFFRFAATSLVAVGAACALARAVRPSIAFSRRWMSELVPYLGSA